MMWYTHARILLKRAWCTYYVCIMQCTLHCIHNEYLSVVAYHYEQHDLGDDGTIISLEIMY